MSTQKLTAAEDAFLREELLRIARQEQPLSVRALYYRAVLSASLPFITKDKSGSRRNERLVQSRCLELRRSGAMPWNWITDPSRADYSVNRWNSPADFSDVAPFYYRRDLWASQQARPVVLVEKAAAIGTVLEHCRRNGVDVVATKGYGSCSQLKDLAEAIGEHIKKDQRVVALVLADFDPSGCDWPRAAEVEVKSHLLRMGLEAGSRQLMFDRVLMTAEQAAGLGQQVALRPPNGEDTRTEAWLDANDFRADQETCVELDAASPKEVRELLTQRFTMLFKGDISTELEAQDQDRDSIKQALAGLGGSK